MIRILLYLIALSSVGCANIPLTTMLKFKDWNASYLTALNPSELQAKVELESPFTLQVEDTVLTVDIDTTRGTQTHRFPLVLTQELKKTQKGGWFSAATSFTEYTFKLPEEAYANLSDVQKMMSTQQKGSVAFGVATKFKAMSAEAEFITLSVQLKLDKTTEYFTLIDSAEIKVDRGDAAYN
ncbi:hypothetical protein OPS25_07570 [Alteromonas ponticola]|uniref:Lipoprotein n=1 Tax=Alteromonas aquimaris TaxID=2998417 RepID=A0ABT3P6H3_9ALTE|nr:hypothetical protein [Alteromonas aquimaris]MCW8108350.1 hypothetical protein [Alteromonas aquimaris]